MMRRSVQLRLCFGLCALAALLVAGLVVATGTEAGAAVVAAGAAAAGGAESDTAGGRSEYFEASVAGAASLTRVVALAVDEVVVCGAELCSPAAAKDRPREPPAWADAEASSMAATRMILRM